MQYREKDPFKILVKGKFIGYFIFIKISCVRL